VPSLRLADILAGLSLIADLGVGNEPEKAMRTCLLAVSLAQQIGVGVEERRDVYYAALLEHAGCTGGAHEAAAYFGDDIALYHAAADQESPGDRERARAGFPWIRRRTGAVHPRRAADGARGSQVKSFRQ
jgi:hypothetical protein